MGMGAGDQLVAVSNYDRNRKDVAKLPKVGDYLTTDWESLASLHPSAMIIQLDPQRVPAGLKQRADSLGIRLVNIHIDRLADIFTTLKTLGEVLHDTAKARQAADHLHEQLDAIKKGHEGRTPVRTLMVVGVQGRSVVGRDNFLNDLLEIAGGENVVPAKMGPWPDIDPELLAQWNPQVVLQLLPRESPQGIEAAQRFWKQFADLSAVKTGQVHILTQWYLLQPGYHVGQTAEVFAQALEGAHATH